MRKLRLHNRKQASELLPYFQGRFDYWLFLFGSFGKYTTLKIKGISWPVKLRSRNAADRDVLKHVIVSKFHLPRSESAQPTTILDLGANIGLSAMHFATLYPNARIVAVEMDAPNVAVARSNCANIPAITILHGAVWPFGGAVLRYAGDADSDAFSVQDRKIKSNSVEVRSFSVPEILSLSGLSQVDYVKMDIEGAELRVLFESNEWLDQVSELNIEVHDDSAIDACIRVLRLRGFYARKDTKHWSAVVATRSAISNL